MSHILSALFSQQKLGVNWGGGKWGGESVEPQLRTAHLRTIDTARAFIYFNYFLFVYHNFDYFTGQKLSEIHDLSYERFSSLT